MVHSMISTYTRDINCIEENLTTAALILQCETVTESSKTIVKMHHN